MEKTVKLLHLDPCPLILAGLKSILADQIHICICEQTTQPQEIFQRWMACQPDLTLFELSGCGLKVFGSIRQITLRNPQAKIIVLSNSQNSEDISRSFQAGVKGYVLKTADKSQLLVAIQRVITGGKYISETLYQNLSTYNDSQYLTPREKEVLKLVYQGIQNKSIANTLCISEWTVKTHIRNILSKLNAISRTEAVSIGLRLGIIPLS